MTSGSLATQRGWRETVTSSDGSHRAPLHRLIAPRPDLDMTNAPALEAPSASRAQSRTESETVRDTAMDSPTENESALLPSIASLEQIAGTAGPLHPPQSYLFPGPGQIPGTLFPTGAKTSASAAPGLPQKTSTTEPAPRVPADDKPASSVVSSDQGRSDSGPPLPSQAYHHHKMPQFSDPWASDEDGIFHHHTMPTSRALNEDREDYVRRRGGNDTPNFPVPRIHSFEHIPRPEPLPLAPRRSSDSPSQNSHIYRPQPVPPMPWRKMPEINATREPWGDPRQSSIILPPLKNVPPPLSRTPSPVKQTPPSGAQTPPSGNQAPAPASQAPPPTLQWIRTRAPTDQPQVPVGNPARETREVTTPLLPEQTVGRWRAVSTSRYGGTTFDLDPPAPEDDAAPGPGSAEEE